MKLKTFAESLSSSLDIKAVNNFFLADRKVTEKILKQLRPEGLLDGNRFKLASIEGGQGKSWDFNLENHQFGDWGTANAGGGKGLVSFVERTLKCSSAQAVRWFSDEKFLDPKAVKKALDEEDGDPLVIPIPEEMQSWDVVREAQCLRKDRGIIKYRWEYRDTDGQLLGWKYRVDDRRTSKEVYTLTYRAESGWTKKAWEKKLVPAYGLESLSDGPTVRVLFVEGEKARDKAKEIFGDRWKILSFSGATGSQSLWIPDDEFWTDCEVVIWPDNDPAGKDSARKIQMKLEALANKPREIRIVRVDTIASLPLKWDLGDWEEGCPVDPAAELERAEKTDSFERVCREWVYVSQPNEFHNLEDRSLVWSTTSFDHTYARYRDKSGSPSAKFHSDLSSQMAHDLDFVPGESQIIHSPSGKRFLNEWYDTPVYAEAKRLAADPDVTDEDIAENAKHFIAHMKRICGDEIAEPDKDFETGEILAGTETRTVLDALTWHFAELVRRPMDKRGWVPMLVSQENGTGKTYFVKMMGAVLGFTRATTVTVAEFIGDYDDWADGLLFYELGEAKSQDDTDVYEKIKKIHSYTPFNSKMLSDRTQNAQKLNIKTKAKKSQRNFLNGYVTANDLFPLALANNSGQDGSDRRLLVINPRHILTEAETIQLFDEELVHRAQWIGAYLIRYRARHKWNPSWAPITAHKRLMMEKDRTRSENRSDKFELGRFDEFYHAVRWAISEKIGALRRKVFTADHIRAICEAQRVKFPYDVGKFDAITKKAGVLPGPIAKIDGVQRRLFTSDESFLVMPLEDWRKELAQPINGEHV